MSLLNVFNVAGSAMSAQSVRLNVVASNLANADSAASSTGQTYRARMPVFSAVYSPDGDGSAVGVRVAGIVQSQAPLRSRYSPGNPLADKNGYIHLPNVNTIEQMADMISASRTYQDNVQVLNTSKQLLLNTLRLGQ
ncbi:MAG: flagellar basal body rod protein FlgC [Chromatiales bacterium 21-64-14]|nr:MAG: flagellar basal body rod protein FlgC [Chromatiales bacterium 21-64-14]HQU15107.1 flagellar basal body rod protein FlgC [Gammaproteobacteria bacterium]